MSVRQRVARRQTGSEHVCQFFDSDESRADAVAGFLADALRAGERVLVVARPVQWAVIVDRLEASRVPVHRQLQQGRLIVKDAADTLRRLTPNGTLAAAAFDEHIAAAVRGLAALGPLRAYGEMVDVLAQRGDFDEALELEEMWNRLGEAVPFSLMCGYAAPHFVAGGTHAALRRICAAHSDVRRGHHDALANWLLTTAHNSIGSSSLYH